MSIQEVVTDRIKTSLNPSFLEVIDVSNCNCGYMFKATIVSESFLGKKLLERQRLVNESIGDVYEKIHSLTMKCYTPDEYDQKS
ncbi:hypothetical protein FG386_001752 [Cryptosporidium ryanae]|uniref:uncharacterized protein n=1 Tax=Cryptosporidium ryanae TaxID=515981 RepID=UPI00351A88B5|nr:hypothetical protein FG386_001752 [Cryptosporidium ryanae]